MASISPKVRHRLIVLHPAGRGVLIDSRGLPQLVTEDRHTAEVDYINAGVAERFGLHTIVLRSLVHSNVVEGVVDRVHELELLGNDALASPILQWRSVEDVQSLDDQADNAVFVQWSRERQLAIVDGREWIERAVRDAGLATAVEIVQLRTWATSSVLLVATATGDCYFKVSLISGRDARSRSSERKRRPEAADVRLV